MTLLIERALSKCITGMRLEPPIMHLDDFFSLGIKKINKDFLMGNHGSEGERILQTKVGTANQASAFYEKQMLNHLNPYMREFISKQEMVFIATADSKGECDCSFRAGKRGFVRVLNKNTLICPEYRGNGVMASLGNILENQHVGMTFIDFFESTIGLHVNGKAKTVKMKN